MSTYTKDQLRAMQDAGVPIELQEYPRVWVCGGPYQFTDDADQYRPQPSFTFKWDTANRLAKRGIRCEEVGGEWCIADSREPAADPAGRPICMRDEIEELIDERDDYARSCSELEKALAKTRMELTDARKERDGERARVSEFIADSSKLNSFRAALKNLLNS
jgi:hypothetical protein